MQNNKKLIVVLFTGHVGSSWVVSLLDSHPAIRQLGFEPVDDLNALDIEAADYIRRILGGAFLDSFPTEVANVLGKRHELPEQLGPDAWATPFADGCDYIAFKTRVSMRLQRRVFFELIPELKPTLVLLRRRNKIKNAISQFKRTQLDISHLRDPGRAREKRQSIVVDTDYILKQSYQFLHRELRTMHYFHAICRKLGMQGFEVCYEDLLNERRRNHFFSGFFRHHGLDDVPLTSEYQKMTNNELQKAVANLDELQQAVSQSIFAPCLVDDSYDIASAIYSGNTSHPAFEGDPEIRRIDALLNSAAPEN